jgi:Hint domain
MAVILPGGGAGTCFCRGTLIRSSRGDMPVEDLVVGDTVLTAAGELRPVRWLGHRAIDCTRYPNPAEVWPYRIRAGAFSDNQPARDLWLSRGHSILVDGVLMQVETLVNGASIVRVPSERVEYWHVELDSHDILIAEGLPAESYLDVGNRTAFVNGGAFLEAYPDFQARHSSETCVPVVTEGPAVQRAKAALLARAELLGYHRTDDADVHIRADGQRIDPVYLDPMRIAFMLPEARASIELRCRSFSPAQINPVSDDTRSLGICVSRLQLDGIDVPLDSEDAVTLGWHELERNPDGQSWRWSHDRTRLPAGTRLLVIDQCNKGPYYWMAPGARPVAAQVG